MRADGRVGRLGAVRAACAEGGSIEAGTWAQISDGAAAVVLAHRAHADRQGWPVLAVIGANGQVAGPDNSLHAQPARAIARALEKEGLEASDLDFVEINEAFGAVVARSQAELGLSSEIVNIHGGGIANGHPIGASGTRLVVHAAHDLARRGRGTAAGGLCGGAGRKHPLAARAGTPGAAAALRGGGPPPPHHPPGRQRAPLGGGREEKRDEAPRARAKN